MHIFKRSQLAAVGGVRRAVVPHLGDPGVAWSDSGGSGAPSRSRSSLSTWNHVEEIPEGESEIGYQGRSGPKSLSQLCPLSLLFHSSMCLVVNFTRPKI